jgi:uncharacterized protein with HEPN domain
MLKRELGDLALSLVQFKKWAGLRKTLIKDYFIRVFKRLLERWKKKCACKKDG